METSQLIIALIGASSTLLAALLNSRSKQKSGLPASKRSLKWRVFKFGFYFLLGGVATYWVINSLLPFGKIDERLTLLESRAASSVALRMPGQRPADSLSSLPVGSVFLSMLPPDKFPSVVPAAEQWIPADGRPLDTACLYTRLTGLGRAPELKPLPAGSAITLTDSSSRRVGPSQAEGEAKHVAYWYVRIN